MPGLVGGLVVVAVAGLLAAWRLRPVRGQHRGLYEPSPPAVRPAGPPWPPAAPVADERDRLWWMAAAYRPVAAERLTAPRVCAARVTRVEVIRAWFEAADRPAVAVLAAHGWPTG